MAIYEVAQMRIKEDKTAEFEAAFTLAVKNILVTPGCHKATLTKGVETPTWYVLLVEWESLEAHQSFRDSERFAAWRGTITEFFTEPPHVEHVTARQTLASLA